MFFVHSQASELQSIQHFGGGPLVCCAQKYSESNQFLVPVFWGSPRRARKKHVFKTGAVYDGPLGIYGAVCCCTFEDLEKSRKLKVCLVRVCDVCESFFSSWRKKLVFSGFYSRRLAARKKHADCEIFAKENRESLREN